MTYSVQKNKANGKWVDMLVIASPTQATFANPIVQMIESDTGKTEIKYYTKGFYKMVEDTSFYYWYLLDHVDTTTTTIDGETLAEYEAALNTLGVETEVQDEAN